MYAKNTEPPRPFFVTALYNKAKEQEKFAKQITESIYRNIQRPATLDDVQIEIKRYLEELSQVDWTHILDEVHQEALQREKDGRKLEEELLGEIIRCGCCQKEMPRRDVFTERMAGINIPGSHYNYCRECFYATLKQYQRVCCLCKSDFLARNPQDNVLLCPQCYTSDKAKAHRLVSGHNQRAKELNLPGTLTLQQWLNTLTFFQEKCAYCLGTYKCLEHYIPLPHAGTTQENCFPACPKCNHIKKDKMPEQFERLFPTANIQRIKEYQHSIANQGVKLG